MNAKLTLKLDKEVIDQAKKYAISNNRRLSEIIESYLKSLTSKEKTDNEEEIVISPFVKSLSSKLNIPPDLDYKAEYTKHLIEKYK